MTYPVDHKNQFSNNHQSKIEAKLKKLQLARGGLIGLALLPLSACGSGGGSQNPTTTTPSPPTPDFTESPTNTFVARDDNNRTLDKSTATANLIVTGKGGNDTITTGSGADTIDGAFGNDTIVSNGGDDIIKGGAGNDKITSGAGADMVRGGEGADTINAGDGDDVVVVVGTTTDNQYDAASITNPEGSGVDLSSLITLADLNGRSVSEVTTGEVIDGGSGSNTLYIYGTVDLTDVTLTNVTQLIVNSDVTLTAAQIAQFTTIDGDGNSVINIVVPEGAGEVILDLSSIDISDVASINISGNITIKISDLTDLTGISEITAGETSELKLDIEPGTGPLTLSLTDLGQTFGQIDSINLSDGVTLQVTTAEEITSLGLGEVSGSGEIDVRGSSEVAEALKNIDVAEGINSKPVIDGPAFNLTEGATTVLARSDFAISDVDDDDASLFIMVSNIIQGQFEVAGNVVTEFTLQNVADGLVSFVHNGSEQAPAFDLAVKDDDRGASYGAPISAAITFTDVNDTPILANYVEELAAISLSDQRLSSINPELTLLQNNNIFLTFQTSIGTTSYLGEVDAYGELIDFSAHSSYFPATFTNYDERIASSDGGYYLIGADNFSEFGSNSATFELHIQKYDHDNVAIGAKTIIDTKQLDYEVNDLGDFYSIKATELVSGNILITYNLLGSATVDIGAKIITPDGVIIREEFRVNTTFDDSQRDVSLQSLDNGNFIATWSSRNQDGDGVGIYGQIFDVNGNKIGPEFRVNNQTIGHQSNSNVIKLDDGGFMVTWLNNDYPNYSLSYQIFEENGNRRGTEGTIDQVSYAHHSSVALSNGEFVILYTSPDKKFLYAQRYESNGSEIGEKFVVAQNYFSSDIIGGFDVTSIGEAGFAVSYSIGSSNQSFVPYIKYYDNDGTPRNNDLFFEGAGAKVIAENITVTDSDPETLLATVSITGDFDANQDHLTLPENAKFSGNYTVATGVLTLTLKEGQLATIADLQAALRTVTYDNSSNNPSGENRTITFNVIDGEITSQSLDVTVRIIKTNDAPVFDQAMVELNAFGLATGDGTASASDPENDALTYSIQTQGSQGTVSIDENTGTYTYTVTDNSDGIDHFVVSVTDGNGAVTSQKVLVNVSATEADQMGDESANILTGTASAETLAGNAGDDVISGHGGADRLFGNTGNDTLVVTDLNFSSLSGGLGQDKMVLDGSGLDLDLTTAIGDKIHEVETIDVTGSGDNSLKINVEDVLGLSSENNQLIIDGNAGDTVTTGSAGWAQQEDQIIETETYYVYTNGEATLLIDEDVTQSILI